MKLSVKKLQQSQSQEKQPRNRRFQISSINLKNILDGVTKRILSQTISKLFVHQFKNKIKVQRLKQMHLISLLQLKTQMREAFTKLKVNKSGVFSITNSAKVFAIMLKYMIKNKLKVGFERINSRYFDCLSQFDEKKHSREIPQRFSEQSNLLSISQGSLISSRTLAEPHKQFKQQFSAIRKENEELNRMMLSQEVRESLMKMQRSDRYIYPFESEKQLKGPVTNELKRLEKMKSQFKEMRSKFYDNQLTITCIYNYVKLISQMNRQITDLTPLKTKVIDLERKISDMSTQHKKEIAQYKKKLMFIDLGSSRDKRQSKQYITQQTNDSQLNREQQVAYNIMVVAIQAKQYSDAKRELKHFLQISKKDLLRGTMMQLLSIVENVEALTAEKRQVQKQRIEIINSLSQFQRHMRNQKLDEMEKIKNKWKASLGIIELTNLFQQILTLNLQVNRLKKSQTNFLNGIQKFSFVQKQKRKGQKQNEELGQRIKTLEMQLRDMQAQRTKLQQNMKKLERSRLSMPPRRPSFNQKDQTKLTEQIKKYQDNQSKLLNQIDVLTKTIQKKQKIDKQNTNRYEELKAENLRVLNQNQRIKLEIESLKCSKPYKAKIYETPRALLSDNSSSKSQCSDNDQERLKQVEDFLIVYDKIRANNYHHSSFDKDLSELKNTYPSSVLPAILQNQLTFQSSHEMIMASIKHVISTFSEGTWKRCPNILLKEQGQIYGYINQVISMLLNLSKEKQQFLKHQSQHKSMLKKCKNLEDQNKELKQEMQQFQVQFRKLHEMNNNLSSDIQSLKIKLKQEKNQQNFIDSNTNLKENDQSQIDYANLTIKHLKAQVERLTNELSKSRLLNTTQKEKQTKEVDQITSLQQKLENYKIILDRTKAQRDNLKLLLEEKNQQYENAKENEEQYESEKKVDQRQIKQLKQRCILIETQNQQLKTQVNSMLNSKKEKSNKQFAVEDQANRTILLNFQQSQNLKNQMNILKQELKVKQQLILQKEACLQDLRRHYEADCIYFNQESDFLRRTCDNLQRQMVVIKENLEGQLVEEQKRSNQIRIQMVTLKQLLVKQKSAFVEKTNELTKISQSISVNYLSQNHQKQELKRQLNLMNTQLATNIRNLQNQKRQNRKCVQKLLNQIQQKNTRYAQQKRILKEEIERARSEEYQINQQKIKKLRQDIQALRMQNQRLTSIIDSNQTPFNQLLQDHKDMYQEILQLKQDNQALLDNISFLQNQKNSLYEIFATSDQQKLTLVSQLNYLEQKIIEFEKKVITVIGQETVDDSANYTVNKQQINHLQEDFVKLEKENSRLEAQVFTQAQQLAVLRAEMLRLETQACKYKLEKDSLDHIKNKRDHYNQYLKQRMQQKEEELINLKSKERQLLQKINELIKVVNSHQIQKQKNLTAMKQMEHELNIVRMNAGSQMIGFNQKINQLQWTINDQQSQITKLREGQKIITDLRGKINQKEIEIKRLLDQNHKLQLEARANSHIHPDFSLNQGRNQRDFFQNKRLISKIQSLQYELKEVQQQYLNSQTKISLLQAKIIQCSISQVVLNQSSKSKILTQEISWHKQQLMIKEAEITELRRSHISFQTQLKQVERKHSEFLFQQQKYSVMQRDLQVLKIRLKDTELEAYRLKSQKKQDQIYHQNRIDEKQQIIRSLNTQINYFLQNARETQQKFSTPRNSDTQLLIQIVKKLDENYKADEDEMYLNVINKINQEIGELIKINKQLKQRNELLSKQNSQTQTEQLQNHLAESLNYILEDFISFLSRNGLINPQSIPQIEDKMSVEKFLFELGPTLKALFAAIVKDNEEQIIKYNNIVRDIRVLIEQIHASKDIQRLEVLLELLRQAN